MWDYFNIIGRARELAPHGYCLLWQPELVWTHVVADALIAAAYFSIPVAIVRFVTGRKDIQFSWIFWLFALFIVACGTTHLMAIWTLWNADYGWEGLIKVVTAIASVGTAIVLWPLIPKALALPSPLQLREANTELSIRIRERDEALDQLKREISDRERAEAALAQAQKMEAVGQLTGGIAHDFNNLLQAMSGSLDLIVNQPGDSEKVRRWAERGLKAAQRGTRLTGQLLAFSRVQQLDLRPVDVAPLIDELLDLFSRTLGTAIQVRTAVEEGSIAVIADKTQLELALLNLAINARDAMPDGGTLTISARSVSDCAPADFPDGCIEISVADTGIGMTPEVVERAFEPFFTTKGLGKGTGLGLSMVYGVAHQSGGFARIESVPGHGTKVVITLGRAVSPASAEPDVVVTTARTDAGGGETILVVDDDSDVRMIVASALELLGYKVEEAEDGPAALAKLRERAPALAIIDFAMPGMNGAEVAAAARRLHPSLPILFASGFADQEALAGAVGPGMPLIRKPFQLADLGAAVGNALGKAY